MSFFLKYTSSAGKFFFPSLLWKHKENSRQIYLTFDDGPIPVITPWALSLLKAYDAKATFFCIGDNVRKHQEIFEQLLAEGHTVGNHTFNHLNGWKTSTEEYIQNVMLAEETISEIGSKFKVQGSKNGIQYSGCKASNSKTVENNNFVSQRKTENRKQKTENLNPATYNLHPTIKKPNFFRPPYGKLKRSQIKKIRQLNYQIVMWDVISGDYDQNRSAEKCYKEVVFQAGPGSIVVFHDSEKASKNLMEVLPRVLEHYKKEGYEFKAL